MVEAAKTTPTGLEAVGAIVLLLDVLCLMDILVQPGSTSRFRFSYELIPLPVYQALGVWPFLIVGVFGVVCFALGRRERKRRDAWYLADSESKSARAPDPQ